LQDAELADRELPLAIEGSILEALSSGLLEVLKPALDLGVVPVAILCSTEIREKVLYFVGATARSLFVLSFEELDPSVPVEQIGTWRLALR
jgi:flagellar biosynthesis component FlhA